MEVADYIINFLGEKGIENLFELGDKLKIPMFPTWNSLGIVTSDYEHYGG